MATSASETVRAACNMKMRKKSSDSLEPARRAYIYTGDGTERDGERQREERGRKIALPGEGGAVWRRATGNGGTRRRRNIEREKEIGRKGKR